MTPLAPHVETFFRIHLAGERGCSRHTCDTYAYAFQLLLSFAATRYRTSPSLLSLEQLDAPLVLDFLAHLELRHRNGAATRNSRLVTTSRSRISSSIDYPRRSTTSAAF